MKFFPSDDGVTRSSGNLIVRMPTRKSYPFKKLYHSKKTLFGKGKYLFTNEKHIYFELCEQVEMFGRKADAYTYEDEYESMPLAEKDNKTVEYGFFILLSTYAADSKELLIEYYARTDIEYIFKTAKNYLDLLPLSKWTDRTVRGKILSDIIVMPLYLHARRQVNLAKRSMTSVIGAMEASMCLVDKQRRIQVEYPTKKVKNIQTALKLPSETNINLTEYFRDMSLLAQC